MQLISDTTGPSGVTFFVHINDCMLKDLIVAVIIQFFFDKPILLTALFNRAVDNSSSSYLAGRSLEYSATASVFPQTHLAQICPLLCAVL